MDSKRPYKYRALRHLFTIVCVMAVLSCTWVKDDTDNCPYGFWLQLRYNYNILDVEAAPRYVHDAYIYIYDADGKYVKRIYVTQDVLTAGNYRVQVEGLPEGDYRFVVWSGIGNSEYAISGDTQTIADFRLSLSGADSIRASRLPELYYGRLDVVHYDDSYALYDVELMKNTNQLACLVVSLSEATEVSVDDFSMKIVSANATLDAYNQLAAADVTTYEPFEKDVVTFDDPDYGELHGVKFSIMTLRLTNSRDCRIILEKKDTGQQLFNISFPDYVGMIGSLYTNMGRPVSVQEYLDRQDFYTVVFYLSDDLSRLIQLQVNSWRLRAYNHLKL